MQNRFLLKNGPVSSDVAHYIKGFEQLAVTVAVAMMEATHSADLKMYIQPSGYHVAHSQISPTTAVHSYDQVAQALGFQLRPQPTGHYLWER
jgi:hypothetical protein